MSTSALGGMIAACGGGGGGSGPAFWAKAICEYESACDEEDFYYDSIEECRRVVEEELVEYVDYFESEYGAACGRAVAAYYDCVVDHYDVNACTYDDDACESEIERAEDLCGGFDARVRAHRAARRIVAR